MRIGIYLLAALSNFLFFTSCSKEESVEIGRNQPAIVNGIFKMKINGTEWTAYNSAYANISDGFIHINGKSRDNKAFLITLSDTLAMTYVLDQSSANVSALSDIADLSGIAYGTNGGTDTSDAGGTVTVTNVDKVNKTISGTFKFRMIREIDGSQKQITEGSFDKISYKTGTPVGTASKTDTIRAKIDNTNWNAVGITVNAAGGSIIISGAAIDGKKSVSLVLPEDITSGTYDFNGLSYIGLYFPTPSTIYASESGKVTVIEHNTTTKRIRGSFSFKATDQIGSMSSQLTEGYFSAKY